jgi:cytochrome P450
MRTPRAPFWPGVPVASGALPLAGHAVAMARSPLEFLVRVGAEADLVEVRLGPQRTLLVGSPELTREVQVRARIFDKGGRLFDKIRETAGNGLVSAPWTVHRRHRPLVQPAFHATRLPGYADVKREEAVALVADWEPGRRLDLTAAMQRYTTSVLARTLVRAPSASELLAELRYLVPVMLRGGYWRAVNPIGLLERIPTSGNRRYDAAIARTRQIADVIIADYRRSGAEHPDMLSVLIAARDEDTGAALTDQDISDHIFTMLVAGTETTASLLAYVSSIEEK